MRSEQVTKGARWDSPGEIFPPLPLLRINARRDHGEVFFQLRHQRDQLLDLLLDIFVLLGGVNVREKWCRFMTLLRND